MFINVHMTPSVVAETSRKAARFNAPALQSGIHRLLHRHGVLNFLSDGEAVAVLDSLKTSDLKPEEVKAWQELLVYLQKSGRLASARPPVIEDLAAATKSDLTALGKLSPLVSILGTELYDQVFPDAAAGVTSVGKKVEAVAPGSLAESQQVKALQDLADTGSYPKGANREVVWRELLAPVARVSKQIVIFDRYLLADLDQQGGPARHVEWLLDKIDQTVRPGTVVKLIGARGIDGQWGQERVPSDAKEAMWYVEDNLPVPTSNLKRVEVWLAPSARYMHHDRHIRFSAGTALELLAGFDRLANTSLREDMGFAYWHSPMKIRELLSRERAVEDNRDSLLVEVPSRS